MTEPNTEPVAEGDVAPSPTSRRPGLAWWSAVVAVVVVAAAGLVLSSRGGDGDAAEAFRIELATTDGRTTTLAELGDRPMVVNFFASWCPPCRVEMPDLERVHQEVGPQVRMVGVNVDYDTTTWRSFVAQSGVTYETVYEPQQDLLRAVGGRGMPTTILVDGEGEVAYVHTGLLDADRLLELLDANGMR
jgi:cytochrome c biogenesis protein CcmG, thiol:disulfide interchange protein DsbE